MVAEHLRPGYDLAIVGAGIVGSVAAYLAARERPEWKIALLDRSLVGHGATLYSGGLDHAYGVSAPQRTIAAESGALYRQIQDAVPGLPVYDLPLYGVVDAGRAREVMSRFTHDGARIGTADDLAQLRRSYPDLALAKGQVLLAGCPAAYGVATGVATGLVAHLQASAGLHCLEGAEVEGVEAVEGAYSLGLADGRTLHALRVLMAGGPWMLRGPAAGVMEAAGVRIKKVVAMHVSRVPTPDDPVVFFFDDDAFLLPLHHRGHWLFSFASEEWDCLPEVSSLRISAADRGRALSILQRYAPSLVPLCQGGRAFCDAYTPGRLPLTERVPSSPGFVVAGGCSGSGFRLAPGIARRALELLPGFAPAADPSQRPPAGTPTPPFPPPHP